MRQTERRGMGPLLDGATVAIVGGGPGGAACAIALSRWARRWGRALKIVIYEGKTFTGEMHYNQCVGVLSPPIVQILEKGLGIPFPWSLVQRRIVGYVLHGESQSLELVEEGEEPSYALRRVEFDAFLLEQARLAGAEVQHSRVTDLEFHADRAIVYSESDCLEADVVVGAFGLDQGTASLFMRATPYRPPRFLDSIVTKAHPPPGYLPSGDAVIHAFLPAVPQIEFGAITPKANHLTINIAGARVDANWMDYFLGYKPARAVLAPLERGHQDNPKDWRYFKGRFPISLARNFYGDRYVLIGDAAGLVRAFKGKGVNSAILTGQWAAQTMAEVGISHQAFTMGYAQACHEIIADLPYGRAFRQLAALGRRLNLIDPLLMVAAQDPALRRALFDAVSGHSTYRAIAQAIDWPRLLVRLLARGSLRGRSRPVVSSTPIK